MISIDSRIGNIPKLKSIVAPVVWEKIIMGEPASKANSRKLVLHPRTRKPMFIKSDKAREYESDFAAQVQKPLAPMAGDIAMTCRIYYSDRRPDLDCSLIQDCLQRCGVIANDRQIKEIHLYHGIDKQCPRAEIELRTL